MDYKEIKKALSADSELNKKYNIKKIGIFGSYNTGNNKKESDIDLLVEFSQTIDLFKFIQLTRELQQLLKIKVDLVTPDALKPYTKDRILNEVDWIA